jgi:hypothetical protein
MDLFSFVFSEGYYFTLNRGAFDSEGGNFQSVVASFGSGQDLGTKCDVYVGGTFVGVVAWRVAGAVYENSCWVFLGK